MATTMRQSWQGVQELLQLGQLPASPAAHCPVRVGRAALIPFNPASYIPYSSVSPYPVRLCPAPAPSLLCSICVFTLPFMHAQVQLDSTRTIGVLMTSTATTASCLEWRAGDGTRVAWWRGCRASGIRWRALNCCPVIQLTAEASVKALKINITHTPRCTQQHIEQQQQHPVSASSQAASTKLFCLKQFEMRALFMASHYPLLPCAPFPSQSIS